MNWDDERLRRMPFERMLSHHPDATSSLRTKQHVSDDAFLPSGRLTGRPNEKPGQNALPRQAEGPSRTADR
ncbi:MAG: hypothetical protein HYV39_02860 [Candidatus Levybacteria bacterium]|nr:hypothetical protein [Candidatus Levybacteria bacterium]